MTSPTVGAVPVPDLDGLVHPLATAAGVHPIPLPTGFPVGPITTWLVEGDPLTLIDTGPPSAVALVALERGLAAHHRRIEDLELVVLTHEHIDHIGLAAIVVERSGAALACSDQLVDRLADISGYGDQQATFMAALLRRHGAPPDVVTALSGPQARFESSTPSTRATRALRDGETIALGGDTYEVLYRPGHSLSDTVLLDRARGLALGGDHLLAAISSNPIVGCPQSRLNPALGPPTAEDRVPTLRRYVESLAATAADAPQVVLSGHGPVVTDAAGLVAERRAATDRRKRRIFTLVAESAPVSTFDVGRTMWGDVAVQQPLLVVSEVLGHLDLLVDDGVLTSDRDEHDVDRWRPV